MHATTNCGKLLTYEVRSGLYLQILPQFLHSLTDACAILLLTRWLAHLYVLCKGGDSCCRRRGFHLDLAPLIDSYRTLFPESITPIAAPRPVFRFLHQTPHHRIAVHVAQLLDPLARRPDVKIIEASLPYMLASHRE